MRQAGSDLGILIGQTVTRKVDSIDFRVSNAKFLLERSRFSTIEDLTPSLHDPIPSHSAQTGSCADGVRSWNFDDAISEP